MIDDFESQEVRSSGELWTEICSSLPETQAEATPEINTEFKDSFQPAAQVGVQEVNGQSNGTNTSSSSARWEPMEDSEIYIASLGTGILPESFMTAGLMSYLAQLVLSPSDHSIHNTSGSYLTSSSIQVVWEIVGMIGFQSPDGHFFPIF